MSLWLHLFPRTLFILSPHLLSANLPSSSFCHPLHCLVCSLFTQSSFHTQFLFFIFFHPLLFLWLHLSLSRSSSTLHIHNTSVPLTCYFLSLTFFYSLFTSQTFFLFSLLLCSPNLPCPYSAATCCPVAPCSVLFNLTKSPTVEIPRAQCMWENYIILTGFLEHTACLVMFRL